MSAKGMNSSFNFKTLKLALGGSRPMAALGAVAFLIASPMARAEVILDADMSRLPASVANLMQPVSGEESHSIDLGRGFSIYIDSHPSAEFNKSTTGWKNKDEKAFTNWKFFENFTDSLQDYKVDFKITAEEATTSTRSFELHHGQKIYKFLRFGDHTWCVLRPGQKDYEVSRSFSFFGEMDASTWSSPFEKSLKIVKDVTASATIRITALRSIIDSSSTDVKSVLKNILMTEGENDEIRQEIVMAYRRQPTNQNIKTLMSLLQTSKSELLRNQITKALRVRNPRGPIIELDDSDKDVENKIATWRSWSHQFSREEASSQ